jgi:hypothetical protein
LVNFISFFMSIYLHVGMHKTASTFLQKNVFPKYASENLIYNPKDLMNLLEEIFIFDYGNQDSILRAKKKVENYSKNNKKLFVSSEQISQLFCSNNYDQNAKIAFEIFPKATIILFLRYQPDWILSSYKQSLQMGDWQDIEKFLNYKDGNFRRVPKNKLLYNSEGFLHTDIYNIDYCKLLKIYFNLFKKENVNVLFYENFQTDPNATVNEISSILSENLDLTQINLEIKSNKSFSQVSINISIFRYKLLKFLWLDKYIHNSKKLRSYLRSNINLASEKENTKWLRRIYIYIKLAPRKQIWRIFIQNFFDKFFNSSYDFLEQNNLRLKLENHFYSQNAELKKLLSKNTLPSSYFFKKEKL